jgi:hypothetical protein
MEGSGHLVCDIVCTEAARYYIFPNIYSDKILES